MFMATDEEGDELISEKYKATALINYLRRKEKIPEVGTSVDREPGS